MVEFSFVSSVAMEIIFALVTLLIALYSFKIYRISYQRELGLFGSGFFLIFFSYLVWIILNISAIMHLANSTFIYEKIEAFNLFNVGAYIHMALFLLGLAILSFVTLKTENKRTLTLLVALALVPIFLASNKALLFYSISIIFMIYLAGYYIAGYVSKKSKSLLTNSISFALLAIGNFLLILAPAPYNLYVAGHSFAFTAYVLLLFNLLHSLQYGKKAK